MFEYDNQLKKPREFEDMQMNTVDDDWETARTNDLGTENGTS